MIFGDWYPALRADRLRRGETAVTMLLGIPMLLGRKSDGKLFAMRDLCPHRGIPLSAGWFDGQTVQCKYHGWKFEPCSGQCTEIPSLTGFDILQPTKIFATSYPCVEKDGYCWVFMPDAGAGRQVDHLVERRRLEHSLDARLVRHVAFAKNKRFAQPLNFGQIAPFEGGIIEVI